MSKIVFLDPIDYISGKIARKYRTIYCYREASDRRYTTVRGKRKMPPTTDELWARTRFAAVATAVKNRKGDLMNYNNDIAAFRAQKDSIGGKKTLQAWYWKVCGEQWDEQHPRN